METPIDPIGRIIEAIAAAFDRRAELRGILVTTNLLNAVWEAAYEVLVVGPAELRTPEHARLPCGPPKPRRARP